MISVCMIVKNESKVIEKSLKSILKYGCEIIVVDTGSEDNTKEIAEKYTDKIFDFKWENDFSKARNFCISKASNDFVLVIDADEIIVNLDKKALEDSINKDNVGRILIINKYSKDGKSFKYNERISRFFNRKLFEYQGIIHEQVVPKNRQEYSINDIPIVIEHCGYEIDEIQRKNKIQRNIKMLETDLENRGLDPYILYQLGKSYYMDGVYDKSEQYFNKALDFDLNPSLEYVQDMVSSLGYSLINQNKYEDSMKLLGVYNEFSVSADFIFLIGLIYMNNGYFDKAITEFKKAKEYKECKMDGVNDYLANYNIGVILECLGKKDEAIIYYEKSCKYTLAKERIKLLGRK